MRRRSGSALITALMLLIVTGVLCLGITVQCAHWRQEYRDLTGFAKQRLEASFVPVAKAHSGD